jgi:hypothetical protein
MKVKICSKCGIEKDVSCFSPDNRHSDGLYSGCRKCCNDNNKQARKLWSTEKKIVKRKKKHDYEKANIDKKKRWDATYRKNHKKEIGLRKRLYYLDHKDELTQYKKDYYEKNKETIREYKHQYYLDHIEQEKLRAKEYYDNNRDAVNKRIVEYKKNNIQVRIAHNGRSVMRRAIKTKSEGGRFHKLIGCSLEDFLSHLSLLWDESMDWSNYGMGVGKWTVDHVIPLEWFDLEKEEDQLRAFHYSNTQPMWYSQNASKSNRYSGKYKG